MKFQLINGKYVFTVCGLGLQQPFTSFKAGVEWVFTTKTAAACAADMEKGS